MGDDMVARGESPGLFGQERSDALESILLNIEQTWGGEALYPTVESRAAHLVLRPRHLATPARPASRGWQRRSDEGGRVWTASRAFELDANSKARPPRSARTRIVEFRAGLALRLADSELAANSKARLAVPSYPRRALQDAQLQCHGLLGLAESELAAN